MFLLNESICEVIDKLPRLQKSLTKSVLMTYGERKDDSCDSHFYASEYGNYLNELRSSRPEVFCEKGVLRNFAKFTGKHLCQGLFLMKLQASGAVAQRCSVKKVFLEIY